VVKFESASFSRKGVTVPVIHGRRKGKKGKRGGRARKRALGSKRQRRGKKISGFVERIHV